MRSCVCSKLAAVTDINKNNRKQKNQNKIAFLSLAFLYLFLFVAFSFDAAKLIVELNYNQNWQNGLECELHDDNKKGSAIGRQRNKIYSETEEAAGNKIEINCTTNKTKKKALKNSNSN